MPGTKTKKARIGRPPGVLTKVRQRVEQLWAEGYEAWEIAEMMDWTSVCRTCNGSTWRITSRDGERLLKRPVRCDECDDGRVPTRQPNTFINVYRRRGWHLPHREGRARRKCPTCGAAPGQPCTRAGRALTKPHANRR